MQNSGIVCLLCVVTLFGASLGLYADSGSDRSHAQLNVNLNLLQNTCAEEISMAWRNGMIMELALNGGNAWQKAGQNPLVRVAPGVLLQQRKASEELSINLKQMFIKRNNFTRLNRIFMLNQLPHFQLGEIEVNKKGNFSGLFCVQKGLHRFVNGTRFDLLAQLSEQRIIGVYLKHPQLLYGFNEKFAGLKQVRLAGKRLIREILPLGPERFLIHRFRLDCSEPALEIADIRGRILKTCFARAPWKPAAEKWRFPFFNTRAAVWSDSIYIAFEFPESPLRIWRLDARSGIIRDLFGYSCNTDKTDPPMEWFTLAPADLNRWGSGNIIHLDRLLTDPQGYLLVFWSENRVLPRGGGKISRRRFLDVYSFSGEFMGRRVFSVSFGMPETVDNNGIIYCRRRMAPRDWALITVRLTLKKSTKKQIR